MNRVAVLLIGVLAGTIGTYTFQAVAATDGAPAEPVYVLVSAKVNDPDGLTAYAEAAGPLARAAGIEIIASIESVPDELVFEGAWPNDGGITIERFESMAAFEDFWNSDGYQASIPLREGKVDINFVVAVPTN